MNPTRSLMRALPSMHFACDALRMVPRTRAARRRPGALTTSGVTSTIATMELLTRVLRGRPDVIEVGDDIAAWWRRFCAEERGASSAFDRAVLAGFRGN